jgi:hypothetical protein
MINSMHMVHDPHHFFFKVFMINNKAKIYLHEYILIWDEERPSLIYPSQVKDYILSSLFEPCIFSWIITQTKITPHTKYVLEVSEWSMKFFK